MQYKKSIILCFIFPILISYSSYAQKNALWVSVGWAGSEIQDITPPANGFNIQMLYDAQLHDGQFSLGFSFGYHAVSASDSAYFNDKYQFVFNRVNTIPVCAEFKYSLGTGNVTGYMKADLGAQYSVYKRSARGLDNYSGNLGLAAGGGAGITLQLNDRYFLFGEYALLWLSDSFFSNGLSQTISVGLQYHF